MAGPDKDLLSKADSLLTLPADQLQDKVDKYLGAAFVRIVPCRAFQGREGAGRNRDDQFLVNRVWHTLFPPLIQSIGGDKPPFPIPETQSAFHPLAQRTVFRRRDVRQQSTSFARWNQSLRHRPNSTRLG